MSLTRRRGLAMLFAGGLATAGLWSAPAANATVRPSGAGGRALIHPLPGDQVFPESVAVDPATGRFWVGSVKDGTIFTGRAGSTRLSVFSPAGADGRTIATGLAFAGGRLVVAGRQTGQIFVYGTRDARLISRLDTGLRAGQTFLNDVTWAPDGSAYVTDSVAPVLWRVRPAGRGYSLERFLEFDGTPVRYVSAAGAPGINVNGVVATADGRHLLIGKRNENALYRIRLADRQITPVTIPDGMLNTPDGLVLDGRTLYAVENLPGAVQIMTLSADLGTVVRGTELTHDSFAFPTGAAVYRGRILVVSSQFNTLGSPAAVSGDTPPDLPFWVSELAL